MSSAGRARRERKDCLRRFSRRAIIRSSPRKRGPSTLAKSWIPAFAGMSGDGAPAHLNSSQKPVRPHHGAPHVRGGRVVEAETLLRLAEVAPDDVDEIVEVHL